MDMQNPSDIGAVAYNNGYQDALSEVDSVLTATMAKLGEGIIKGEGSVYDWERFNLLGETRADILDVPVVVYPYTIALIDKFPITFQDFVQYIQEVAPR